MRSTSAVQLIQAALGANRSMPDKRHTGIETNKGPSQRSTTRPCAAGQDTNIETTNRTSSDKALKVHPFEPGESRHQEAEEILGVPTNRAEAPGG